MNIMFMGTPDFAVCALEAILSEGYCVNSVVTTPDKPRGRGHIMTHTAVYECAEKNGIDIFTPVNLKKENFERILNEKKPDMIVVAAYGKILPKYVLDYPKYGCINIHGSLLPKYRGAAPIQRVIIDGEKLTGVTTMYMDEGLDTGDMLLKEEVPIDISDNFETLHDKMAIAGAKVITETIKALNNGTCKRTPQDDSLSNYAQMITKETALINWNDSANNIYNLVRGLFPIPKAYTKYNGKNLKICGCRVPKENKSDAVPGTIAEVSKDSFSVVCKNGEIIEIVSIQPEGKKVMSVSDFLKGNSIEKNIILG